MMAGTTVAFKEWAIVVEALGAGEQILILRKGGIHEKRGEFSVTHREFWLFPTQYHEDEHSVIASKRPALRELAARATAELIPIQYYAVADPVIRIAELQLLGRLQGHHIWSEHILQQRFEFGREKGLHALLLRVYRLPVAEEFVPREAYGGCKSWVEMDRPVSTSELAPVLTDGEFDRQRNEIIERLSQNALTHS